MINEFHKMCPLCGNYKNHVTGVNHPKKDFLATLHLECTVCLGDHKVVLPAKSLRQYLGME